MEDRSPQIILATTLFMAVGLTVLSLAFIAVIINELAQVAELADAVMLTKAW